MDGGDDATTGADGSMEAGAAPRDSGAPDSSRELEGSSSDASSGGAAEGGAVAPGDAGCASTMALVAIGATSIASARFASGQWSGAEVVAQTGALPPAMPRLISFGGGYLAAFVAGGSAAPLESIGYAGTWSGPSRVGLLAAQGTPALAVLGSAAHVVYWGGDGLYYHGAYAGSWDASNERLEVDGGAPSFGSSAPALAAVGASLVAVQSGTNQVLYDQTWTAGTWQAATAHPGTSLVATLSPAVVALQGGAADLMVAYVRAGDANDYHLDFTTRTASVWSAPVEVFDASGNVAYTGTTPTLAALPGGGAILAWLGGNSLPYATIYDPAAGWAAPMPIAVPSKAGLALSSAPSVIAGVCGLAVVAAYVETSGQVDVTTLTGVSWSVPAAITGATGMQSVAIASSP